MGRDAKIPDAEAVAEEEEQYGHLQQVEDLNAKYDCVRHDQTSFLTVPDTRIGHTTIRRLCHFMNSISICSTL
jgi:hypothetical protein